LGRHPGAELQELRLDLLEDQAAVPGSCPVDPKKLLVTCRPESEGGRFGGSDELRLNLLKSFLETGPGWVDIELSTGEQERKEIIELARRAGTRVLISQHVFEQEAASQIEGKFARLAAADGDAVKLAVTVEDAAELRVLYYVGKQTNRPNVLVGMGPAGLLSRALYTRFGSSWTYVASREGGQTAEGQYTLEQFGHYRLPPDPEARLFVLLGGAQILKSPGPQVYNQLFATKGINACYLPVITDRPAETLNFLLSMGLKGASVTMPLKQKVVKLMDSLGEEAAATDAVNTITVESDERLSGDLTDGSGAAMVLQKKCGQLVGKRCVILGTGATAAAIAQSLTANKASVTILGRDQYQAEFLATRFGAAGFGDIADLTSVPFDVLVQATPVGADDEQATLVADTSLLTGKVVLDVVVGNETRLLRDTREAGGVPVPGRALWAEQGRLQLARWLGLAIPVSMLGDRP
jgi:3-dehydroquinate dehydratase/shikimate dehydrogenase